MDLKKLYSDVCILAGEMPIYSFLTYCDMFARHVIAAYGKLYAVGEGEYSTPEELCDSYAIDDVFFGAARLYIAGQAMGNGELLAKSETEAENAYRTRWRAAVRGKRIKGVSF